MAGVDVPPVASIFFRAHGTVLLASFTKAAIDQFIQEIYAISRIHRIEYMLTFFLFCPFFFVVCFISRCALNEESRFAPPFALKGGSFSRPKENPMKVFPSGRYEQR